MIDVSIVKDCDNTCAALYLKSSFCRPCSLGDGGVKRLVLCFVCNLVDAVQELDIRLCHVLGVVQVKRREPSECLGLGIACISARDRELIVRLLFENRCCRTSLDVANGRCKSRSEEYKKNDKKGGNLHDGEAVEIVEIELAAVEKWTARL